MVRVQALTASISIAMASAKVFFFNDFISEVRRVTFQDVKIVNAVFQVNVENVKVRDEAAFEEMKSHILYMYHGVDVKHSFRRISQHFDCVTMQSQPSVLRRGIKDIASPPLDMPSVENATEEKLTGLQRTQSMRDLFGLSASCPAGSIPMLRLSFDRLLAFPSLQAFLSKYPEPESGGHVHRYAHAYKNSRYNIGGESTLSIHNPWGHFSLSQQWWSAGSGSDLQTVEVGWIHMADKWDPSVAFVFSTSDNYATGCYNLDCAAFVQVSSNWFWGHSFTGGSSGEITYKVKLFEGNWWVGAPRIDEVGWIGYYPGSYFGSGQMSRYATAIDFGGETWNGNYGEWPEMGSGYSAFDHVNAAYQYGMAYFTIDGQHFWYADDLMTDADQDYCYNIDSVKSPSCPWSGPCIYFGGIGCSKASDSALVTIFA